MAKLMSLTSNENTPFEALRAWSSGRTHETLCSILDPRYPQVTATEFAASRTACPELMNGPHAPQYAKAFGRAVAWMHTRDSAWLDGEVGKNEEENGIKHVQASAREEVL